MARAFQNAGYSTGHIGKWHMGGGRDVHNAPSIMNYGFDEYISTYESPDPDPTITATKWIWSDKDSVKRWRTYEYFVDKSIEFVKKHKDEPFFLNLWPDDMHTLGYRNSNKRKEKLGNTRSICSCTSGDGQNNSDVSSKPWMSWEWEKIQSLFSLATMVLHPALNLYVLLI